VLFAFATIVQNYLYDVSGKICITFFSSHVSDEVSVCYELYGLRRGMSILWGTIFFAIMKFVLLHGCFYGNENEILDGNSFAGNKIFSVILIHYGRKNGIRRSSVDMC
jgi:hypothetical protein